MNDGITGKSREELPDLERAMPMTTGVIDSKTPYKLFEKHGYKGPVVCEPIEPLKTLAQKMSAEEVVKLFADGYARLK